MSNMPVTESLAMSPFPGHPLCIALSIVRSYPCYEYADKGGPSSPEYRPALANNNIRGAGGNVRAALDFLKFSLKGHREKAAEAAERYWLSTAEYFGESRVAQGKEQARRIEAELFAALQAWPHSLNVAPVLAQA